jgi:hypothetical protein
MPLILYNLCMQQLFRKLINQSFTLNTTENTPDSALHGVESSQRTQLGMLSTVVASICFNLKNESLTVAQRLELEQQLISKSLDLATLNIHLLNLGDAELKWNDEKVQSIKAQMELVAQSISALQTFVTITKDAYLKPEWSDIFSNFEVQRRIFVQLSYLDAYSPHRSEKIDKFKKRIQPILSKMAQLPGEHDLEKQIKFESNLLVNKIFSK